MKIEAIIVDDEPLARARLNRLLVSQGIDVVAQGENGHEAVQLVLKHDVDILFIDINMPIKTGLEAVAEISEKLEELPAIVFCTAYDQYAVDAFQTDAVAYLLKPIQGEDVAAAIEKASSVNKFQREQLFEEKVDSKTLSVHYEGVLQNVLIDRFLYFYSENKNVFAVLECGQEIFVDYTLKALEADFPDDFIRTHRAYLVNKKQISSLLRSDSGAELTLLEGDSHIPISRRHLSEVKKCFQ